MKVKVLIATHKKYDMPNSNIYLPIMVGKDLHSDCRISFQGDNTGNNISSKNPNYNELTALYWGWKNITDVDAIGLVHYRRYLSLYHKKNLQYILNITDIERLLKKAPIILPKKRNYFIETNYSHYIHAHHRLPLDKTKEIIRNYYPEYLSAYDKVMKSTSAHMFNILIMKKDLCDKYCCWLFDILSKLENSIDISSYSTYEKRVYGFISELLLDVWINTNQLKYNEVNCVYMEKQNWLKKGGNFLLRKFGYNVKE